MLKAISLISNRLLSYTIRGTFRYFEATPPQPSVHACLECLQNSAL